MIFSLKLNLLSFLFAIRLQHPFLYNAYHTDSPTFFLISFVIFLQCSDLSRVTSTFPENLSCLKNL